MTDPHTSSSTSSTITDALRLPLASLPMAVLPGSVVTLPLSSEQLRVAVTAARRATDPRVVLRVGDDDALGVVAQVPDVGNLPSGDPAAIVRIDGDCEGLIDLAVEVQGFDAVAVCSCRP